MECGRKLGTYLRKRLKMKREAERRDVFERYIGEISKAVSAVNGADAAKLYDALLAQAKKRTAVADLKLDDEGRRLAEEDPADQEGVIVVETAVPGAISMAGPDTDGKAPKGSAAAAADPFTVSKAEAARLKVAAMAGEDDEPKLINVDVAKRAKAPTGGKSKPKKTDAPKAAPPAAAPAPKAAKPRMRMVNGKLVPVEEKGLF
ncbi:MAG: hypothetical protein K2Q20_05085, partial [Phycisphaerales bacterium]|nr:hypothetical protein [Phycisphaerales bacterium]